MRLTLPELTKNRADIDWLWKRTLFLTAHGSHAYGTNLPTSDHDYKGFAIPPKAYFHGFAKRFEQAEFKGELDMTVYDIRKFFKLAADCNPSTIEVLFTDNQAHQIVHPLGALILQNRDLFISKKAKFTFSGYATAQLKRIKTHYRWISNPPKEPPTRAEFGLPERTVIPADQLQAAQAMIRKQVEHWNVPVDELDDAAKVAVQERFTEALAVIKVGKEEMEAIAGRLLGFDSNFLELLDQERRYRTKMEEWRSYQSWLVNRNEKRSELEKKWGYDCYTNDTEFLTDIGWRRYDDILPTHKLATLNQTTGHLEFQPYSERVKKAYSGPICVFETQKTACMVTPNHRMWVSPLSRSKKTGFSCTYDPQRASWQIVRAGQLRVGKNKHLHIRAATEGAAASYDVGDDMLIAIGAYVSEGCVGKRNKQGTPTTLRFSQMEGGRLCEFMERFGAVSGVKFRRYVYARKNRSRKEVVWTLNAPVTVEAITRWCLEYSDNKRLPTWITKLSQEQARLLMAVLIAGDGTNKKYSDVYYTISKGLADDMQALAVVCGYSSQVWGPYRNRNNEKPIYQVYINKNQYSVVSSAQGTSKVKFEGEIVCFTVPNETLITRRNGKTAVHGNTKHGMHLVRLMRMGTEIMEGKGVIVRRPDAEELLAIRNGLWKYEDLLSWAESQEKKLDQLYQTSPLPKSPPVGRLDALLVSVVETGLSTLEE